MRKLKSKVSAICLNLKCPWELNLSYMIWGLDDWKKMRKLKSKASATCLKSQVSLRIKPLVFLSKKILNLLYMIWGSDDWKKTE